LLNRLETVWKQLSALSSPEEAAGAVVCLCANPQFAYLVPKSHPTVH
jgi:hypothetical protein